MVKKIIQFLILGFILLSSYAHTFFSLKVPVLGRLTPADFLGISALILSPFLLKSIKVSRLLVSYTILIVAFTAGVFVTQNMVSTMVELGILIYLGLLFMLFINSNSTALDFKKIIMVFTWSSLVACTISLWDLSTMSTGLPRILNLGADHRLPSGTFRNGGQAGAYMLLSMTILFPVLTSNISKLFTARQYSLILITFVLAFITIFANAKIAAIIGALISFVFYLAMKRKFSLLLPMFVIGGLLISLFNFLVSTDSKVASRLRFKYRTRIENVVNADDSAGPSTAVEWMEGNYGAAVDAFLTYPLTGSGIGGFHGVFHRNEVHSTPLKILGETGLLGIIGYTIFTLSIFLMFFRLSKDHENPFRNYLSHMLPFLLGCYISWTYTYHLRKREFWVLLFVIHLATYLMSHYDQEKKEWLKRQQELLLKPRQSNSSVKM